MALFNAIRKRKCGALSVLLALLVLLTASCAGDAQESSASGELSGSVPADYSDVPLPSGFEDESSEEPAPPAPDMSTEDNMLLLEDTDETYACRQLFAWSSNAGVLLRKGSRTEQIFPASLTKLVTALVALEHADPETECTAGDELSLVASGSSIAYIPKGSRSTLGMLLEGLLLPSGCDAAFVIAANVGRIIKPDTPNAVTAVSVFVQEMNDWSKAHGIMHSNWMNPDGNHHDLHYTCLEDMMRVGELVLASPEILKYTRIGKEHTNLLSGEGNTWTNTNHYVNPESKYYDPACFGLKTGQTSEAGGCLMTAFQYGDEVVLIGIFGSGTRDARFDVTDQVLSFVKTVRGIGGADQTETSAETSMDASMDASIELSAA